MAKKDKSYVAYLKDGTAVRFVHAIDYRTALGRGLLAYPPGQDPPPVKEEPVGEAVDGVNVLANDQGREPADPELDPESEVEEPASDESEKPKGKKKKITR